MTETPTAGQAHLLRHAVRMGGAFGPLAVDLRSYDACLRRGWLMEEAIERGFGLGPGIVARLTDDGQAALALVDHGDTAP